MPSILNRKAEQLRDLVKARRSRRSFEKQQELDYLCDAYQRGYTADSVNYISYTNEGVEKASIIINQNARINLKKEYLMIEDLNFKQTEDLKLTSVINFSEIAFMSTDLITDVTRL